MDWHVRQTGYSGREHHNPLALASSRSCNAAVCYLRLKAAPCWLLQAEGDYHYDSRKAQLLWSILLVDDTNRSGQLEFTLPGSYPEDAFFPVDVSFSAQHTLADVSIVQARSLDLNPKP